MRISFLAGVDLVLINDKGDPPVCKIIDYGKYKYSQERKKKENQKKQSKQDLKEVRKRTWTRQTLSYSYRPPFYTIPGQDVL